MLVSSVIIFSDAITNSLFGLFVHCGGLIYHLSIWRAEFLSVATHKQWTFLGIIYFIGRFLICPYLDVFLK